MRALVYLYTILCLMAMCNVAMAMNVVMEAESMTVEGKSWTVANHVKEVYEGYPSDSAMLNGCAGGQGYSRGVISVPETGDYILWVRYLNVPGAFTVKMSQGQKSLGTVTLGAALENGGLEFVAGKIPVHLQAGKVQIVLGKGTDKPTNPLARSIDCFILTDDPAYQPKIEDLVKPVYMKIRIEKKQKLACAIHVFGVRPYAWQDMWYIPHCNIYRTRIAMDEAGVSEDCNDLKSGALKPGDESPWFDLSKILTPHGGNAIELSAIQTYPATLPESYFTVMLSHTQDNSGIFKTFTRAGVGGGMLVNLDLMDAANTKTDLGYSAENKAKAEKLPPVEGKRPTKFPVFTGCGLNSKFHQSASLDNERYVLEKLGMNGADNDDPYWFKHGFPYFQGGAAYFGNVTFYDNGTYCTYKLNLEGVNSIIDMAVTAALERPAEKPKPLFWNQMDEMATVELRHMPECRDCPTGLREYLKGRGFTPADFGVAAWEEIKPVIDSKGDPKLFYWTMKFRNQIGPDYFKVGTDRIRKTFPDVRLGCNFNEDLTYQGNNLASGVDWFGIYEQNTLNYGWTEDWINGSFTTQFAGYRGDFLRSACRFGELPHGIFSVLKMPWDTAVKAVSQIGHGASAIEYYTYGPDYAGSLDGASRHSELWPFLRRTNYLVGEVEDYLVGAKRPRSRVGLLYLETSDIWTLDNPYGFSNFGKERQGQYLLLTHLGYPLDVLTENNMIAGEAKKYDALFVTGSHMRRETLAPLVQWVKDGGQLYMDAGSLRLDEFNAALDTDAQLGISRGEFEFLQNVGQDNQLFTLNVKEKINAGKLGEVEVVCSRQALADMPTAGTLATFADGSPALVSVPVGKGRVYVSGINLGLAYMKSGSAIREEEQNELLRNNKRSDFYCPSHYDAAPRELAGSIMANVPYKPEVHSDQYLVEANLLVGEKGRVVTLSNYGGKDVTVNLTVNLAAGEKIGKPFVAGSKNLTVSRQSDTLHLRFTIPETAFAVIPKAE